MADLVKMIRTADGKTADVHPAEVAQMKGWEIAARPVDIRPAAAPSPVATEGESGVVSDDQLRDEIERLTGVRPHHRTGREKLVGMWQEAEAKAEI